MSNNHPESESQQPASTEPSVRVRYHGVWRRFFAFSGPAYLISVGYMDPGNWATDLEGGARFGYELLWVLLASNLIAVLLQSFAARLGIVSGEDLAQACRSMYPRPLSFSLWVLCEIAIAAVDLAEVIGTVIGLNLLFGLPPLVGLILTSFDTLLFLTIQRLGIRKLEAFILVLIATVGACFIIEIVLVHPDWAGVAGGLIPRIYDRAPFVFSSNDALYVAIGILGATVMPHNLYLHSSLVQTRKIGASPKQKRQACKYNLIDSIVALNLAFLVNAAILVLSAAAFHIAGESAAQLQNIRLEDAHKLLHRVLGSNVAPTAFAIALLASGQSSTVTGTLAGQVVMEGFLHIRLTPWIRRLVTRVAAIIPAFITIWYMGPRSMTALLVLSQVVLSLQLPFAIVPLLQLTSDPVRMGNFSNRHWWRVLGWVTVAIIIVLNGRLVWVQFADWFVAAGSKAIWLKVILVPPTAILALLLVWLIVRPWCVRSHDSTSAEQSPPEPTHSARLSSVEETANVVVESLSKPVYARIGVALDHSLHDSATLRHAIAIARAHHAELVLIHVVDGTAGHVHGGDADDDERRSDEFYLACLGSKLSDLDIPIATELRFGDAAAQIIQVAEERSLDLLVFGSHGHGWLADWLYGETVRQVRHRVKVPVMIVREPDTDVMQATANDETIDDDANEIE